MPAVVRFDPFRDITSLRDEMNRLFTRTLGEGSSAGSAWTPAVDIFDAADSIVLKAELPGLSPDDIDIEIDDNVLTLKGERRFEEMVEEGRYYRVERAYGVLPAQRHPAAGREAGRDHGDLRQRRADRARAEGGRGQAAQDRRGGQRGRGGVTHADPYRAPEPRAPEPEAVPADAEEAAAPAERNGSEELARAEAERDQYLDALQRLKAEFDNYRKRTERDRQAVGGGGHSARSCAGCCP